MIATATAMAMPIMVMAYLLLAIAPAAGVATHAGDAVAMHQLAIAMGADGALDWSAGSDPCADQWLGVTCDGAGRVTGIIVRGVGLNGSLPSDFGGLSALTTLDVSDNQLTGPLPRPWSLPRLDTLRIDNNWFTEVPWGFFSTIRALRHFSATNNRKLREWELPRYDLRRLTKLSTFEVDNARITGTLVHFLGDEGDGAFPNLAKVSLANNELSGPLPDKFASQGLGRLDLSHNHLSGAIVSVAGLVNLVELHLDGNEFAGPLPDFTNLKALAVLSLADNRLTGVVPAALAELDSLRSVSLTGNFLQGPLPKFGGTVKADVEAAASNGSFCRLDYGPCDPRVRILLSIAAGFGYPEVLARTWRQNDPCAGWVGVYCGIASGGGEIRRLNLCHMGLNGTMDPAFGSLTTLVEVLVSGNNITGVIPPSVTKLPSLRLLDVSDNALEGTVPEFSGDDVELWFSGNPKLNAANITSCSPPSMSAKVFSVAGNITVVMAFLVFCICSGY